MSVLGVDIGTTGCKVVAVDAGGEVRARAHREYPLVVPRPGWAELDADAVWHAAADCIREASDQVRADPPRALAVATLGEAVVPVDARGAPLGHAVVSFDGRAAAEAAAFVENVGAETIYAITGLRPLPHYSVAKLMWWRRHAPALYRAAWKFLWFGDLVAVRLGLEPVVDHSMAARSLLFEPRRGRWSARLLAAAGVDAEKLPTPAPAGSTCGVLASRTCGDLGLAPGARLVVGGLDQACAAIGAQLRAAGDVMLSLGTTAVLGASVPAPVPDGTRRAIPTMPHVLASQEIALGGVAAGGAMLRWFRDQLGAEEAATARRAGRDVYEVIVAQAADRATNVMMTPHLGGSRLAFDDPGATGVVAGLSFATTRADLVRALLDGVAYELAVVRDRFARAGLPTRVLHAVGGGSRSDAWMQIMADALDAPVRALPVADAAALGAALLCLRADAGEPAGARNGVAAGPRRVFEPRAAWRAYHADRLRAFADLHAALGGVYPRLARPPGPLTES
jgi:xylulokinase